MEAPFPYFGGKGRVAALVWERLGDVANYLEPFAGSAAVLLARPDSHSWWERVETINDADGMVSNFWRAVQAAPAEVARWADWPVNENDLHARHLWLVSRRAELSSRLEGDPDYYDAKVAGWWVWGMCSWIGGGWCSGNGPWRAVDGVMVHAASDAGKGVHRQLPNVGNAGKGVHRKLPHLGDAGTGVRRQLPHLGDAARGHVAAYRQHLVDMMEALADRLRRVRVCSGEWSRLCGYSVTTSFGVTGVFLDPPYPAEAGREHGIYAVDSTDVAHSARDWALSHGDDPLLRIALCGYDEHEHLIPPSWERLRWKAHGGYGSQGNGRGRGNARREVVYFSPHCLDGSRPVQLSWLE